MLHKIGLYSAIGSFVFGTILVLCFFFTDNRSQFMELGFIFVIVAGIVNAGIALMLLIDTVKNKENRKKTLITLAVVLLNIPISAIYFHVVMKEYLKGMEHF